MEIVETLQVRYKRVKIVKMEKPTESKNHAMKLDIGGINKIQIPSSKDINVGDVTKQIFQNYFNATTAAVGEYARAGFTDIKIGSIGTILVLPNPRKRKREADSAYDRYASDDDTIADLSLELSTERDNDDKVKEEGEKISEEKGEEAENPNDDAGLTLIDGNPNLYGIWNPNPHKRRPSEASIPETVTCESQPDSLPEFILDIDV